MLIKWVIPEKVHTPPTGEISPVWRGKVQNVLVIIMKHTSMSESGRTVKSQFPSTGKVWMF
jgi:hypothetical protein